MTDCRQVPFRLVVHDLHESNNFTTVETRRNFYYLEHVESPADNIVLSNSENIDDNLSFIAILSASFSNYVKLVDLFLFSNFVNLFKFPPP